jgi:hypothetical protein
MATRYQLWSNLGLKSEHASMDAAIAAKYSQLYYNAHWIKVVEVDEARKAFLALDRQVLDAFIDTLDCE